ncbi:MULTISPECIES: hypothetical protein [unclassified Acinetobacter]|uniref:hypothetical protein n=1 Tax=unclassified Acinetobacter TaxID=196816 RepID=UPI0015D31BCE|nr:MULTISPECIES: hypothetical protein [unclassified Acinetobacter]
MKGLNRQLKNPNRKKDIVHFTISFLDVDRVAELKKFSERYPAQQLSMACSQSS